MVSLLLLTLSAALAAPPDALTPLPPGRHVQVSEVPGEVRLFVGGDRAGLIRLRRTSDRVDDDPTCAGGGVDLFAPDLAEDPWLLESCERLVKVPPTIPPGPRAGDHATEVAGAPGVLVLDPVLLDDQGRLQPARFPWRWLHPVVLLWAAALLWGLPRQGVPWMLGFLALGVRIAFTPDRILMSGDMPFMAYVTATGLDIGPPSPAPTWTALMGPLWLALGRPLDLPHPANLAFSVLTVMLVWDLVWRWYGPRGASAAAVILALMPLPIAVSRSESLFPLAALLQVAAVVGAERGIPGLLLAATSIILLAHLHPAMVIVSVALTVWLYWRSSSLTASAIAGVGTALAAGRMVGWLLQAPGAVPIPNASSLSADLLAGPNATLSVGNPVVTPVAITALALAAAVWMPRGRRRFLAIAGICLGLSTLPYLHLPQPTDVARFQLPGQVWLAVLAGAGWSVLNRRTLVLWTLALLVSWGAARAPLGGRRWTWTAEHDALKRALPFIPDNQTVRYRLANPGSPWQQLWLQLHQRGVWRSLLDGPIQVGEYRWAGRADLGHAPDECALDTVIEELIERYNANSDVPTGVLVGMYVVVDCTSPLPPLDAGPLQDLSVQTPVRSLSDGARHPAPLALP